jgi:hypothetical protein
MSHDINASNTAMHLSVRPSLRKQQLKAAALLKSATHEAAVNIATVWNNIPDAVRNHPAAIMTALRASSAYHPNTRNSISINAMTGRALRIIECSKVRINGNDSPTILAWIGANYEWLQRFDRYNAHRYYEYMLNERWERQCLNPDASPDVELVVQPWAAGEDCKSAKHLWLREWCMQNCTTINDVITYLGRNRHVRSSHRSAVTTIDSLPLAMRLEHVRNTISNTRAIHWESALAPFALKLAHRMRPQGACLGIELEFVACKNSDLARWDGDDYPQNTFHSFKGDGSISSVDDDETTAYYQEYTAFINGDSAEDWSKVSATLKALTDAGALINQTCGNHVHIDMRHLSQASYYRTAGRVRDAINTWAHRLVSHKRAYNRYCSILNSHTGNRYTAVNTACWSEHRTLEVRLGMPTLNPVKLMYWSRFLQYLCRKGASIDTLDDFMNGDAPFDLKHYVIKRINKFNHTYVNAGRGSIANLDVYTKAIDALDRCNYDYTINDSNA